MLRKTSETTWEEGVSLQTIQSLVPKKQRALITQSLVDKVNAMSEDPDIGAYFGDNFIDHIRVLKEGKFKLAEYFDAVKYNSYLLRGDTKKDSWIKTFPHRYDRIITAKMKEGMTKPEADQEISPHVNSYDKSKLVNLIREQSLIPAHVLNAGLFQEALNVQAQLMRGAKSEMVRMNAAAKLLEVLKVPETQKVQLEIGIKETDAIDDLRKVTQELSMVQRRAIESGSNSVKEIAESRIVSRDDYIDAEVED
jgi:hypothetical protein